MGRTTEESRWVGDTLRFFAEFTLSGDSSVISFLQNDINEGLRMTQDNMPLKYTWVS
jgi:hypothetical protein